MSTQPQSPWPEISFQDRMATARFDVGERAHIVVDGTACADCSTKACVVACPANLFVPTSDGGIVFNYEQCFECGTCYLVCNHEGAITWTYPDGGHGVVFPPHVIAACLKWTAPPGDESDDRFAGVSAADLAALEVALQLGETLGVPVMAVASGPTGAERALRDALACGAACAVRIEAPADADSHDVAFELAQATADATVVVCGDYSLDRGSGSVPAFIAHHRRVAQALGLVQVELDRCHLGAVHAVRRLDGGRREVLTVPTPCVLSVEGSVASLRRAGLKQSLSARTAPVELRVSPPPHHHTTPAIVTPYRPRARVLPSPQGPDALTRLRAITDLGAAPARGETIELDPRAAAERIAEALRGWGYLS